jgi:hypothetical protein
VAVSSLAGKRKVEGSPTPLNQLDKSEEATDWMIRVSNPCRGKRLFCFQIVQTGSGSTQPTIKWALRILSPELKRPTPELGHLPPSSAEVKNE